MAAAIGADHRDRINARFGRRFPLFSEVAFSQERALPDVWEVVPNCKADLVAARRYAEEVMDHIVKGMPDFARWMDGFVAGSDRPM